MILVGLVINIRKIRVKKHLKGYKYLSIFEPRAVTVVAVVEVQRDFIAVNEPVFKCCTNEQSSPSFKDWLKGPHSLKMWDNSTRKAYIQNSDGYASHVGYDPENG